MKSIFILKRLKLANVENNTEDTTSVHRVYRLMTKVVT